MGLSAIRPQPRRGRRFVNKIYIFSVVLVMASCLLAQNVGTIVHTRETIGPINKDILTWTSGTNNNSVSASTTYYIRGQILRVLFAPTATSATNIFSITAKDGTGYDILEGRGADVASNAVKNITIGVPVVSDYVTNVIPMAVNDLFMVALTNCGVTNSGQIIIYSR